MKYTMMIGLAFFFHLFSICIYGQLWKQYSDSADSFNAQKKFDKSIDFFSKAKEELKRDSAGTSNYAHICNNLAKAYGDLRQYEKAEPLFLEAIEIFEKILGKQHPSYAKSCINLAVIYEDMAKYDKAELLYLEIKQMREKTLGTDNLEYASSCNSLGVLYWKMSKYEIAESLLLETIKIREKLLGKDHPHSAGTRSNLAALYFRMANYEKAEPLFIETKQTRERLLGKEHPDYAASCNNLGVLYYAMSRYAEAELLYLEAKNIREKVLGKEHPEYAATCNNLAGLYMDMGQFKKAEPLLLEAKQIREIRFGKKHPDYAQSCINLAGLYRKIGQYDKSELFYLEGRQIMKIVLGKEHHAYVLSYRNLGILYENMGQYEKAELLYSEARQMMEKLIGKGNPDYASACDDLGRIYHLKGQYEKADSLLTEAKTVREKVLGKEHPEYASSCFNLASSYIDRGQFEKADPLLTEAKAIREKVFGKEHPEYAETCNNLAALYNLTGKYAKAEPLFTEARQIRERALGKEHPEYAETCFNLGKLYRNLNMPEKANLFYQESYESQNILVKKIFQFTNEVEQQLYLKKIADNRKQFLSFNASGHSHSHQGVTYNFSLSNRSLILSSSQQLRNAIYNTNDTSVKNKYNIWINFKEQIAFWHTKAIAERPAYVTGLEDQANALEKELARLSSAFKSQQQKKEINWNTIQQMLQPNQASIEFVEFRYYNGNRWTDSTYYIALLLRKDEQEPKLIQLFEKKQLDSLLKRAESPVIDNTINALYRDNTSLYDLAWMPLEKYLNGISKIYFASAGNLFKISLAALPVHDKQVLADKYQLVQLNTTATVTDDKQSFIAASDKIQLYGGVQYDADSATLKQAVSLYQTGIASARSLPGDLKRGAGFQYLPGTLREVEAIKKEAGNTRAFITVLSGLNATEESFKSQSIEASPSVLHIATHGFFFPDPKDDKSDSLQQKSENNGKAFKQSDNPLFRSGLLFAGANNAWQGKPIEGIEDGILTAYEVSNMYLPNTKLVVLSACETGLGDIQGSEGVYGLQRAFKMAGVQNLVMSLWKIGDRETAEFMQLFYKNLFDKQSVSDAFYSAQTIMKNKYRDEPYKWAAWILVR